MGGRGSRGGRNWGDGGGDEGEGVGGNLHPDKFPVMPVQPVWNPTLRSVCLDQCS